MVQLGDVVGGRLAGTDDAPPPVQEFVQGVDQFVLDLLLAAEEFHLFQQQDITPVPVAALKVFDPVPLECPDHLIGKLLGRDIPHAGGRLAGHQQVSHAWVRWLLPNPGSAMR